MTKEQILEKVKAIVVDWLGVEPDEVKPESKFIDDLGADSLDLIELSIAAEEEFDIDIPDEDVMTLTTLQAAVDYIFSHQK